jgi:ribonuclease P protein component
VFPCRQASATNPQRIASAGSGPAGRDRRQTPIAVPSSTAAPLSTTPLTAKSAIPPDPHPAIASHARDWRLHKHADYQRVYQASRKQFSTLLTYFVAAQSAGIAGAGPRVGITAGKVLGKAVERNRIKRRMRAAIVGNLHALRCDVDVVLHPKRSVLTAEWPALRNEVRRIFVKIEESHTRSLPEREGPGREA